MRSRPADSCVHSLLWNVQQSASVFLEEEQPVSSRVGHLSEHKFVVPTNIQEDSGLRRSDRNTRNVEPFSKQFIGVPRDGALPGQSQNHVFRVYSGRRSEGTFRNKVPVDKVGYAFDAQCLSI